MSVVETIFVNTWQPELSSDDQNAAVTALESGKILFFPNMIFNLGNDEKPLLDIVPKKSKNISYNSHNHRTGGLDAHHDTLITCMDRYRVQATQLLSAVIPHYTNNLQTGLTSLRTVEAQNRQAPSDKKDDTRLHIDAFPSRPTGGKRILRVFCNINQADKPRVWHAGESFETVAMRFLPQMKRRCVCTAKLKQLLKITKGLQTAYDHTMLQLHDLMKLDDNYQKTVTHHECLFPPGSTWIVYSDQVSHAALSGQHMLEQTFYLPVDAMHDPSTSPLKTLERLTQKTLVSV